MHKHIQIRTYIHIYIHACIHTNIQMYLHIYLYIYIYIHINTFILRYIHKNGCSDAKIDMNIIFWCMHLFINLSCCVVVFLIILLLFYHLFLLLGDLNEGCIPALGRLPKGIEYMRCMCI